MFVRHDSDEPESPLRTGQAGNEFKPVIDGEPDLLVSKQVNSAFYGAPDLDGWLRSAGLESVTVCGITTSHCCETTVRMAGNLGYETLFAIDATHGFDLTGPDGEVVTADELARASAANLDGEFAEVVPTAELVERLRSS
ncbi:MAG: hypothetical protein QOJ07_79 [Thermoleophilaceae bacterium]|nr:hypothetical protein [Thermoleophilaceae bacterium]